MESVPQHKGSPKARYDFVRACAVLIFIQLAWLCLPANGLGANKRVLLQLANIRQWVDSQSAVSTTIRKSGGRTSDSQSYGTTLSYGFATDYAILNRRLAQGKVNISLGAGFEGQRSDASLRGDQSSADYELEYRADLNLFKRRPYRLYFLGQQKSLLISQPFSDSYTLLNTNYQANLSLQNDYVPVNFNFNRTESETSGTAADRSQVTDRFLVSARHKVGNWMQNAAQFDTASTESSVVGRAPQPRNESYNLSGTNRLSWDIRSYANSLDSKYTLRDISGQRDFTSIRWDEDLRMQFGKALKAGAEYRYLKDTLEGASRQRTSQSGWLRHKLFRSLDSNLRYTTGKTTSFAGKQAFWNRAFGVNYEKNLPHENRLILSYNNSYAVYDNDLRIDRLQVVDEGQVVTISGVRLNNTGIDVSSIEVFNQDRTVTYLPGVDYSVATIGDIVILDFFAVGLSGAINLGDQLSIDYEFEVDRSIEFSSTTNNYGAELSLWRNRYRIYSRFSTSEQDLIAGGTSSASFGSSYSLLFGVTASLLPFSFDASFEHQVEPDSDEKNYSSSLSYLQQVRGGRLSVNLNENYSVFEQDRLAGRNWRNTLDLTANYQKVYGPVQIRYRGRFIDLRTSTQQKNELELLADAEYRWRKLIAQLLVENTWLFAESDSTELRIELNLRRYF
jgi:hypothetical protein